MAVESSTRQSVLIRDNNQCQGCGDGHPGLHIHHIIPDGPDDKENLVALCPGCHRQLHRRFEDEEKLHPDLLDELGGDDLGPADEALLDMLNDGRVTAPFVAEETGYSLQYVRDRLNRLVEHGNARKVYEGLYELVEDPREVDDGDS